MHMRKIQWILLMNIIKPFDVIVSTIVEQFKEADIVSLVENKHEGKILFYRYSKKWHGFIYSLHKDDKLILLKMILEICRYNEYVCNTINTHDSQSTIRYPFFYLP